MTKRASKARRELVFHSVSFQDDFGASTRGALHVFDLPFHLRILSLGRDCIETFDGSLKRWKFELRRVTVEIEFLEGKTHMAA